MLIGAIEPIPIKDRRCNCLMNDLVLVFLEQESKPTQMVVMPDIKRCCCSSTDMTDKTVISN